MPNAFYFLHIDKTVSLPFDTGIMTLLYDRLSSAGIDVSLNARHKDHNFWRPLPNNYFIFSVFRDPIARTVADFCYAMMYDEFHTYRTFDSSVKENTYHINATNFEFWLHNVHTPNYQSRVFLSGNKVWETDDISAQIRRVDLMLRNSDLEKDKQAGVVNRILKAFSLEEESGDVPAYFEQGWFDHVSTMFLHTLRNESEELLNEVKELNKVDLNVWNTNDYFPSGFSMCL